MIVKHPSKAGWLIATDEVQQLLNVEYRIAQPDGPPLHPLHFFEPDFLDEDLKKLQEWIIEQLKIWLEEHRIIAGITEAMYLEAVRWLAQPTTSFGLKQYQGRLDSEAYALSIIEVWKKIRRNYKTTISLIKQAKSIDEISIILIRRI